MKITIKAPKTYKTAANAEKAVKDAGCEALRDLRGLPIRWFIMQGEDGRFFPVFIGEAAVQAGVHFKFNVVG